MSASPVPDHLTAQDVLSASEVAELLHIPISTVHDYGRRGVLPSVKVGRHRLYLRRNLETLLLGVPDDSR